MAFEGRVWPWAALVLLLLAAMATTAEAAGHRALLQGNSGDRWGAADTSFSHQRTQGLQGAPVTVLPCAAAAAETRALHQVRLWRQMTPSTRSLRWQRTR